MLQALTRDYYSDLLFFEELKREECDEKQTTICKTLYLLQVIN